jgi:hypothetical protein
MLPACRLYVRVRLTWNNPDAGCGSDAVALGDEEVALGDMEIALGGGEVALGDADAGADHAVCHNHCR